jgi:hypothetical protein
MHANAATATRLRTSSPTKRRAARAADSPRRRRRPHDLPREYRIAYVYRTLGRGLVVEYDPD